MHDLQANDRKLGVTGIVLLCKALHPYMHSQPRKKWVPGRTENACVCVCTRTCVICVPYLWLPSCVLPRELRWCMNEQGSMIRG